MWADIAATAFKDNCGVDDYLKNINDQMLKLVSKYESSKNNILNVRRHKEVCRRIKNE